MANVVEEPYADVSEFELPRRMRSLATRIAEKLIGAARRRVAEAVDKRDAAMRDAETAIDEVKAQIASVEQREDEELEKFLDEVVSKSRNVTNAVRESASYHMRTESLGKIQVAETAAAPRRLRRRSLPKLNKTLSVHQRRLKKLENIERKPLIRASEVGLCAVLALLTVMVSGNVFEDEIESIFTPVFNYLDISTYFFIPLMVLVVSFLLLLLIAFVRHRWIYGRARRLCGRIMAGAERIHQDLDAHEQLARREAAAKVKKANNRLLPPVEKKCAAAIKAADQALCHELDAMIPEVRTLANQLHADVAQLWQDSSYAAMEWSDPRWEGWAPDPSPEFAGRIGVLTISADDLSESLPGVDFHFRLPALIPYSDDRCLLLEAEGSAKDAASSALQPAVIRALANTPPGKARFTLIDPVGLGQNVADFMHLGDYNTQLITGKVWTEPQDIEKQLASLMENMETIIQTYLRNQYASIHAYNQDHPDVAEPFRFLVIFDFPVNFDDAACRRLLNIVKNGPRCGVHTLILRDTSKQLPHGFDVEELQREAVVLSAGGVVQNDTLFGVEIEEATETDTPSVVAEAICEAIGLGLFQARLLATAGGVVKECLSPHEAQALAEGLAAAGAKVQIYPCDSEVKDDTRAHQLKIGKILTARVTQIKEYAAFFEVMPGQEGYCHISDLAESDIDKVEDVIKFGDMARVKIIGGLNDYGTLQLSLKQAIFKRPATARRCEMGTWRPFAWNEFVWNETALSQFVLVPDGPPSPELSQIIINKSGEMAAEGMKKDVPFEKFIGSVLKEYSWSVCSTAEGLAVPMGPAGRGMPQELVLGGGQETHAILAGRTGSGKTNLMHVIITTLALTYSPTELDLYLIDFKGGVGFKRYATHRLPHAKVIAIESEREFGMSVLQGLDAELNRRSELFRAAGVDNLAAYRRQNAAEALPRILLVVDEFQEFFSEDDDAAQQARLIFDRLARQGRSYGLHFFLATQSLSGSAQLPANIMSQIKVRIALPCSESDSRLILSDENKAARSLSEPGEGIYNAMGGLVEGNKPFQAVRFDEEEDLHKYLTLVAEMARQQKIEASPRIFEGNELACTEDCGPLKDLLAASDWPEGAKCANLYLGEPIAMLPPVAARIRRQSGRNLMIVTRDEAEGVGMCVSMLLSILVQQRPEERRIHIADFTTADSEWADHAEEIAQGFPGDIRVVGRQREVARMLADIAGEVHARGENGAVSGSLYLVLQGMHRMKALREDDEDDDGNNAVELLQAILRDGPEVGVHVVAWADTFANATRGLSRRAIGEFGLRAAGVMSSDESMNFLDDMAASRITKPHRAVFLDEDRPGQLVTFRPYALPKPAWLQAAGATLRGRNGSPTA